MNRYIKVGNKYMVQVYKTKNNCFFWIDKEDYRKVNRYSWHYHTKGKNDRKSNYGMIRATINHKNISIHRLIMGEPKDLNRNIIDHIDCNTCNNCKDNLRFVTNKENLNNRK